MRRIAPGRAIYILLSKIQLAVSIKNSFLQRSLCNWWYASLYIFVVLSRMFVCSVIQLVAALISHALSSVPCAKNRLWTWLPTRTRPEDSEAVRSSIDARPSKENVLWQRVSLFVDSTTKGSRLRRSAGMECWSCWVGSNQLANRANVSLMTLGSNPGVNPMNGASSIQPRTRPTSFSYCGSHISVQISPPPIEWPMTNRGTSWLWASLSDMKAETSAVICLVDPVSPQSDLLGALRPQPRWSHPNVWIPWAARWLKNSL